MRTKIDALRRERKKSLSIFWQTNERKADPINRDEANVFVTCPEVRYVPEILKMILPEMQLRRMLENLIKCHLFTAAIGGSAVTGFSKLQEPTPIEESRNKSKRETRRNWTHRCLAPSHAINNSPRV